MRLPVMFDMDHHPFILGRDHSQPDFARPMPIIFPWAQQDDQAAI
jgi:hypothetical protein